MSDGIDTKYPIVVQFSTDGKAKFYYSHVLRSTVKSIIKAVGSKASKSMLVCHNCEDKFDTRKQLNNHKVGCK